VEDVKATVEELVAVVEVVVGVSWSVEQNSTSAIPPHKKWRNQKWRNQKWVQEQGHSPRQQQPASRSSMGQLLQFRLLLLPPTMGVFFAGGQKLLLLLPPPPPPLPLLLLPVTLTALRLSAAAAHSRCPPHPIRRRPQVLVRPPLLQSLHQLPRTLRSAPDHLQRKRPFLATLP
jgi:hypothetical protein